MHQALGQALFMHYFIYFSQLYVTFSFKMTDEKIEAQGVGDQPRVTQLELRFEDKLTPEPTLFTLPSPHCSLPKHGLCGQMAHSTF